MPGRSEGTWSQVPCSHPPTTWKALILRPLSGSLVCSLLGLCPLVLSLVTAGLASDNSEANKHRARSWLLSPPQVTPQHYTLFCIRRKSISMIIFILEASLPLPMSSFPSLQGLYARPVLPTNRAPGILGS